MLVSPRDLVAACLPDPAFLGEAMRGATCAGVWVTGTGKDGRPREVYLYHVVDNADTMSEYGAQCVVWQTAVNPVVALELLATGVWSGRRRPRSGGVRRRTLPGAAGRRVRIALGPAGAHPAHPAHPRGFGPASRLSLDSGYTAYSAKIRRAVLPD